MEGNGFSCLQLGKKWFSMSLLRFPWERKPFQFENLSFFSHCKVEMYLKECLKALKNSAHFETSASAELRCSRFVYNTREERFYCSFKKVFM